MLIISKKSVVDVDRKGKKVVINILVDPPMYPPYPGQLSGRLSTVGTAWRQPDVRLTSDCLRN